MGKNKAFILLGAGVFIALLVSLFTYGWLQKKTRVQVQTVETQPVAVAAIDIAWGTVLTDDMLKTETFLKKSLAHGYFPDKAAPRGRTVLYPIKTGEPIFESKLAPLTVQTGGVGALVTPKKRAMAVKVDKVIGVSGFIHPGNRVDVLVSIPKRGDQQESANLPVTKTVLENILVLATGTEVEKTGKQEKPVQVDVITLEVTPEEGEKLALGATEGKVQLALRNALDNQEVKTRGTTIPTLLASLGAAKERSAKPGAKKAEKPKAAPSQEKPPAFVVELIKGSAVSQIKFERGGKSR